MAGADVVTNVNSQIMGAVTSVNVMNTIGWIVFAVVIIGAAFFGIMAYNNNRQYKKKITVLEVVGINYVPTFADKAKVVKIGTGGFEILFLKKLKCYRIGYGGRVGKDTYYFFVGKDGYWYNGMLSADIYQIDKHKGFIPIVTTNPAMRAQYTSLEKQIDSLHAEKKSFMDKYGGWMMGIGFVLVIGVFFWLIAKEASPMFGSISSISDKQAIMLDKINILLQNVNYVNQSASSGLIHVGG